MSQAALPQTAAARRLVLLTRVLWTIAIAAVAGAFAGWIAAQFLHVPQVDQLAGFRPAAATGVYAADGRQVASYALERRVELEPDDIPDHFKLAIVAAEDAQFYEHGGVDPKAIFRAAFYSIVDRRFGSRGGASTLTQQLALNLFLSRDRTLARKIKEALLAIDIEKRYSKDQILTLYANQIFLGHGAYGVEAASRLYFDCPAREVTLAQAAMLAGLIPSPSNKYDPIRRPDSALERRNRVLERMLELGFVDEAAFRQATAEPLGAGLHRDRGTTGDYFLELVRQEIEGRYGTGALYTDGLEVHLTMDPQLQAMAEQAVREGLVALDMAQGFRDPANVVRDRLAESAESWEHPSWRGLAPAAASMQVGVVTAVDASAAEVRIGRLSGRIGRQNVRWTGTTTVSRVLEVGDRVLVRLPEELPEDPSASLELGLLQEPDLEGALLAMDNSTGAILAMVGGFDFERSEFNRAVQAARQCGSAFKPFVFLAAFQQGYTPADVVFDAPFLLPDAEGQLTYCPRNYYGSYHGITTLRNALEDSYNASAVKLQNLVGGEAVIEAARRFGISSPLHPYASLALGSFELKLLELVRAYAGFANMGELPTPHIVTEVHDRDGRLKERTFPQVERVAPASVTYLLTHALRGVVERGTATAAARLDANLAGKTGTTDDYTDAWFIGYSPRITVGVWVGRNLKTPIGRRQSGAAAALPIWIGFMEPYLATLSEEERAEDFPVPPGVVFSPVDHATGRRAVPGCTEVVLEAFLDGTEPEEACSADLHEVMQLPWPFQQASYSPRPGEPMPTLEAIQAADARTLDEE